MHELNKKTEAAAVCDEKPVCCCDSSESTPFSRLVEEKRALDEKIVKLHGFLSRIAERTRVRSQALHK